MTIAAPTPIALYNAISPASTALAGFGVATATVNAAITATIATFIRLIMGPPQYCSRGPGMLDISLAARPRSREATPTCTRSPIEGAARTSRYVKGAEEHEHLVFGRHPTAQSASLARAIRSTRRGVARAV